MGSDSGVDIDFLFVGTVMFTREIEKRLHSVQFLGYVSL